MNSAKLQLKNTSPVKWVSFWKNKKNLLFLTTILTICAIVYLPSLQNGFVNYDDNRNIYENPNITNIISWESFFESVKGIFTTHIIGNYNPLSILSFAFEKMIYGLENPQLWHLDNIILHLICVLLVFRITLALGLKIIPAAFCALLFGIHPMRVESVAWVTERKDMLFGSFYLLALYYYIKSIKLSFQNRYVFIILLSFILALLSKIQAVSLPLSMLLVDYYFDRKMSLKLVYEKWLYFLLSFLTGIVGLYFLRVHDSLGRSHEIYTFFERILLGSFSYVIYLIKSVVPYKMVPMYFYPDTINWIYFTSMGIVITILGSTYYFFLKQKKVFVFGLLFFTFNIMFLLQIFSAGQAFIADRFTYIPYWGLFFIYAFGVQWLLEKFKKFDKLIYLTGIFIISLLGYINFEQNKIWENGATLWSHVLKYYPKASRAWENRGAYYKREERLEEALRDYNKAIALSPNKARLYGRRGKLYLDLNSNHSETLKLALHDYTKAIQYSPETVEYLVNRAGTYALLYMFDNALQDLIAAERLDPTNHDIFYNKYIIYKKLGQYDMAQSQLDIYMKLKSL